MEAVVIASGTWLYDGIAPTTVRMVRLDWDFWYGIDEADGLLEPDQVSKLNADGHAYYVKHRDVWQESDQYFWPDAGSCLTLEAATTAAEAVIPRAVTLDWIDGARQRPTSGE